MKNICSIIFIITSVSCSAMELQKTNSEIIEEEKIYRNPQHELFKAAKYGKIENIQELLTLPIDINAQDQYGRTALVTAAIFYRTEAAKVLIGAGADVDVKTPEGTTAIFYACNWGDLELINTLLAKRANPNPRMGPEEYSPCAGMTPLIALAKGWNPDFPRYIKTMEKLIEAGADTKIVDSSSHTVDHYIKDHWYYSKAQRAVLFEMIQKLRS